MRSVRFSQVFFDVQGAEALSLYHLAQEKNCLWNLNLYESLIKWMCVKALSIIISVAKRKYLIRLLLKFFWGAYSDVALWSCGWFVYCTTDLLRPFFFATNLEQPLLESDLSLLRTLEMADGRGQSVWAFRPSLRSQMFENMASGSDEFWWGLETATALRKPPSSSSHKDAV